jgi:hypothetical protein
MTIEDLEHIFKPQIDSGIPEVLLWFMLQDGEHKVVERHKSTDLSGLLPMLDSFQYAGSAGNMPRFTK